MATSLRRSSRNWQRRHYNYAGVRQRRTLLIATASVGGIVLIATAIPFVESMSLSVAAKAAGAAVEADIATIVPGQLLSVDWRGKPVWTLHRTEEMLILLGKHDDLLADPRSLQPQQPPSAENPVRSIKPPYFAAIGICMHLGCVPLSRRDTPSADLGQGWPGGFYCPCHCSKFDLAGRVFKNVLAPLNLMIPSYRSLTDMRIHIGEDTPAR